MTISTAWLLWCQKKMIRFSNDELGGMRKKAMEDYLVEFCPSANGSLENNTKTITVTAASCYVKIQTECDLDMFLLT
jgi:hypothetical protein